MPPKLAIVAGGTGGHLYPAIEVARVYEELWGQKALFLTRAGADSQKVSAAGLDPVPFLDTSPPQSKKDYPGYALKLFKGNLKAKALLKNFGATHLLGFGNYISLCAAWGLPASIALGAHEANGVIGRANLLLLPRLKGLYLSFESSLGQVPKAHQERTTVVGFPVRTGEKFVKEEAKKRLGVTDYRPLLMVMGGSLGAKKLNEAVLAALPNLKEWQVYWICGERDFAWLKGAVSPLPEGVQLVAYEQQMPLVWAASDLAVTRAGAGTLFEAWTYAKPLIMVPYPFATHDHQNKNAQEWRDRFDCALLADGTLNGKILLKTLGEMTQEKRAEIVEKMKAVTPRESAREMLAHFLETPAP